MEVVFPSTPMKYLNLFRRKHIFFLAASDCLPKYYLQIPRENMEKNTNRTLDMTTGSAVRHIILFAIPMLIGNIFQQVYNLVDSVIVGQFVGADALAAVGATGSITFFFFAICNGIGSGGGIVVSQFFGNREYQKVKQCIANTGYIMFFFPLVVGLVSCLFARPLLQLLKTPTEILDVATGYTQVLCVGLLFVSLYNYASAMLRALGDSKTPLYFLIITSLLNVVLDILFVYTFRMGVFGAGLATVIAQFISAAACLIYAWKRNPFCKLEKADFVVSGQIIRKIVYLGVPLSLQFSLIAISSMAVQRVVNSFGTIVVAAFTATTRIEQIIHMPFQSLGSSLATYCGQNFGAGRHDRVLNGYRKSLLMMAVCTVFLVLLIYVFGGPITALFVADEEVIALGKLGLRISSLFYIFLGLIYVVRGILNGVGDAFFSLFNGIVEVIGRFTIPILMCSYLGFGEMGIWWSAGVVWAISGVTAWMRYLKYYKYATRNGGRTN